jgi:hypothetical protein
MAGCFLRSLGWSFVISGVLEFAVDLFTARLSWDGFYFSVLGIVLGWALLWIERYRRS